MEASQPAPHRSAAAAIPALSALLQGPLGFAHDSLILQDGPDDALPDEALPCDALLDPGVLRGILDLYAARYPGHDRRAAVSMWTQAYALRLIYPVVAANLALRHGLPVGITETSVVLDEDGGPRCFRLHHAGAAISGDCGFRCCATLLEEHLAPLAAALVGAGEIGERLFWNNVGVRVAGTIRILRSSCDGIGGAELLTSPCRPDGTRNPLFRTVAGHPCDGDCVMRRRVCCLRYMLPGLEAGCGESCPLPACGRAARKRGLN